MSKPEIVQQLGYLVREDAALEQMHKLQLALVDSPLNVELHHQLARVTLDAINVLKEGTANPYTLTQNVITKSLSSLAPSIEVNRLHRLTGLYITIAANTPKAAAKLQEIPLPRPSRARLPGRVPDRKVTALLKDMLSVLGTRTMRAPEIATLLAQRGHTFRGISTAPGTYVGVLLHQLSTRPRRFQGRRILLFKRVGRGLYRAAPAAADRITHQQGPDRSPQTSARDRAPEAKR